MKRSGVALLVTLALTLLAGPLPAVAQQLAKVPRVGVVWSPGGHDEEAFRKGLHEQGYVEGKNLLLEQRLIEGKNERIPGLVDDLVRLPVDVLVTSGTRAAHEATQATSAIPIVFVAVSE